MSEIQQGLLISAIGMGLVFGVIIFLWGLMALMMRLTSRTTAVDEKQFSKIKSTEPRLPERQNIERQQRVIAAAMVVKLMLEAEKMTLSQDKVNKFGQLSPWQAHHRTRQMQHKRTRG